MDNAVFMSKHPENVEGWNGSLEDLAKAISRLRYDKLQEFIGHLASQIFEDARADNRRGRKELSDELHKCSRHLYRTALRFGNVWDVCKTHMGE